MSLNFVTQKLKTQRLEEDEDGKITRRNINTTVSLYTSPFQFEKKCLYIINFSLFTNSISTCKHFNKSFAR